MLEADANVVRGPVPSLKTMSSGPRLCRPEIRLSDLLKAKLDPAVAVHDPVALDDHVPRRVGQRFQKCRRHARADACLSGRSAKATGRDCRAWTRVDAFVDVDPSPRRIGRPSRRNLEQALLDDAAGRAHWVRVAR